MPNSILIFLKRGPKIPNLLQTAKVKTLLVQKFNVQFTSSKRPCQ